MLSTLVHTALFIAFGTCIVAADLHIDTPTLTQCQNSIISYSGGVGGYNIYVVPSEEPCADSVVDIPEQSGTSYKWKVTIPAGSKVQLLVEDSTDAEAWSGIVTVNNSGDSSCIDSKAVQALNAANGAPATNSSSSGAPTPVTTTNSPTVSGGSTAAKTVSPAAAPVAVANAAGSANTPSTSPSSGSIPRAALPAGSLIAAAALILTLAHY